MTAGVTAATREAYEHWAPLYPPEPHNPLMRAEQRVMLENYPAVAGCRVLDLGCGTGRYAQIAAQQGAGHVVALDFCMPMLARVRGAQRVCASMMQLPFAARSFDIVVSGLAVGHAPDLVAWAFEVARVLRDGGSLLYSDFHPDAARVRLTRSFSDEQQRSWTVPHFRHDLASQLAALRAAGLEVAATHEVRVGRELHEPFEDSTSFYAQWDGLALVLVVRADKVRADT
jgi:ubiquinone/menaquinone biosynthesis C-methylase UbiE